MCSWQLGMCISKSFAVLSSISVVLGTRYNIVEVCEISGDFCCSSFCGLRFTSSGCAPVNHS